MDKCLIASAALMLVCLVGPAAVEEKGSGPTDRAVMGKILRVNTDKRTLDLTVEGDRSGKDPVSGKAAPGGGSDRPKDWTIHFSVPHMAGITLDGKAVTMKELKAGQYARVHSNRAASNAGALKGPASTTERKSTVQKVEAFTRTPSDAGASKSANR